MIYTIKSHPTKYKGVLFSSKLEARWAAFFDLLRVRWEYEPVDLAGWTPDFYVHIACTCGHRHDCLAEVKPFRFDQQWTGHPIMREWGSTESDGGLMRLGVNPQCSCLWFNHKGEFHHDFCWFATEYEIGELWNKAGNKVKYQPTPVRGSRLVSGSEHRIVIV